MQIVPVGQIPDKWPRLVQLMQDVWPDWYGPNGQGDALSDLRDRAGPPRPQGWAACVNAEPIATVALYDTSYGAQGDEGPWLTGLVTHPDHRGAGIASALVCHVESACDQHIFTTTREATPLFIRRGWRVQRQIEDGWQVLRFR